MADRWHVIQNLVEALERCLLRFRPALKAAAGGGNSVLGPLPSSSETELVPWQQRAEAVSQQKHAVLVERYERMRELRAAGFTVLDIAQMVGATRPTVYRYLALDAPPRRQRSQRSMRRVLASYEPYLIKRWAEGCRNRSRLFRGRSAPAGVSVQRQDRFALPQAPRTRAISVGSSATTAHRHQGAISTSGGVLVDLAQGATARGGTGLPEATVRSRADDHARLRAGPGVHRHGAWSVRATGSMPG